MVTHRAAESAVFRAIGDPTRRRLLEELARGRRSAGDLARRFPSSRPAVARHLRVLRGAGLVRARARGRQRIYELRPAPLRAVQTWLARYEIFWSARLDELESYLANESESETERGRNGGRS
jgi:DNA-binding transcriptional ArsR family regulator